MYCPEVRIERVTGLWFRGLGCSGVLHSGLRFTGFKVRGFWINRARNFFSQDRTRMHDRMMYCPEVRRPAPHRPVDGVRPNHDLPDQCLPLDSALELDPKKSEITISLWPT